MKIYLAGASGAKKREIIWMSLADKRLFSFYEIKYDKNDTHYQRRGFELNINENLHRIDSTRNRK